MVWKEPEIRPDVVWERPELVWQGAPGRLQGGAGKNLRVYGLYLRAPAGCHDCGTTTLFAAREARAASGSAWRLSTPQFISLWGLRI